MIYELVEIKKYSEDFSSRYYHKKYYSKLDPKLIDDLPAPQEENPKVVPKYVQYNLGGRFLYG
jgi:hypothetical protein